ncbi:unnamed protein product [Protopolystoma xenopodis]|uniref:Uncharacterized protein n=1 Tax=Protopolystoma xenopodis TaxID=117903 RepID=A0A448WY01_9PLAT|nr:unnamed protein product [Protopolystoma xenopodis]
MFTIWLDNEDNVYLLTESAETRKQSQSPFIHRLLEFASRHPQQMAAAKRHFDPLAGHVGLRAEDWDPGRNEPPPQVSHRSLDSAEDAGIWQADSSSYTGLGLTGFQGETLETEFGSQLREHLATFGADPGLLATLMDNIPCRSARRLAARCRDMAEVESGPAWNDCTAMPADGLQTSGSFDSKAATLGSGNGVYTSTFRVVMIYLSWLQEYYRDRVLRARRRGELNR